MMLQSKIIRAIVSTFNLTKTDAEIIQTLTDNKEGLLVSEITERIQRSERNVRARVKILFEKGILHRKVEILGNKRLAYRYYLQPYEKIIEAMKKHLTGKIRKLNLLLTKETNKTP